MKLKLNEDFDVRKITNALIEAAEDGIYNWESIARAALMYMSEDEVADMARLNDFLSEINYFRGDFE